ncbi:uncharacterized protein TRAVEDRAFT_60370 [Trametes versicolor FP-101664 SS1]|uniref:uncharacterized protein n=1 Tax=Trametes versicolor (strain FP-101664) TaxID=717944 RepID=UPI00046223D5|nr:uncharacterized protein TRAVEDRAFT_60370 [Trametes versicolor FP-101664 SS1]EIW55085.1 hypothetical protein TRAVEDRAFT_60370 [Trametes versicolor FP-101664 SS1]
MVAHVLAHCTNLRKLDLQGCNVLFMDEPVVPEAISALPNLAHLSTVTYIYSEESQALLLQMVGNMKSSLRAARCGTSPSSSGRLRAAVLHLYCPGPYLLRRPHPASESQQEPSSAP